MNIVPFFQEDNAAQTSAKAAEDALVTFFTALASTELTSLNGTCCESGVLNIEKYIPYWIIKEKETKGGNALTIFDFIQKYYDWLYCSSDDCGGSGYILENKLLDIIDIDKTKELYYKKIFFSYFGDFDENEKIKDKNGLVIDNQTVASFVKNIKTKFNTRKGSEESLKLFFNKLFSVDLSDIEISYPKEQILRLNSGAFSSQYSGFTGGGESGTLNRYRFQDGNIFQDYSYMLHTGIDLAASGYQSLYLRSLHPAGLKSGIELRIEDYDVFGGDDEQWVTQTPLLKEYSSYIIGQTYGNDATYEIIIGDQTYYGLTYTTGCTSTIFGGPASLRVFPSWSIGMTNYDKFLDIPISEMFTLEYNINTVNPNTATSCP